MDNVQSPSIPGHVHDEENTPLVQPPRPQSQARIFSALSTSKPPSGEPVQESPEPFHRHKRRLHLRNAGFRGSFIHSRNLSSTVPSWSSLFEESHSTERKDSSSCASQNKILYSEDDPPKPVSILQEIGNTAQRRQRSPFSSSGMSFHASVGQENDTDVAIPAWCRDVYSRTPCSLDVPNTPGFDDAKSSQNSIRSPTPPLCSPLTHVNKRTKRAGSHRSTSLEASKYIEYLEAQLATLQKQRELQADSEVQSSQLRSLASQVRTLQKEVEDWEKYFDTRVQEELCHQNDILNVLKAKLKTMEEELKIKDTKLVESERELENTKLKLRDREGLDATNRNLERRVDVLTELLAQSPGKREPRASSAMPAELSFARKTRQSFSAIPRLPSTPKIATARRQSAFSLAWSAENDKETLPDQKSPQRELSTYRTDSQAGQLSLSEELASVDSGLGTSCSSRHHRSMSIDELESPYTDIAQKSCVESQFKSSNRRKMRRFPSGSCSLRPLVLPVASGAITTPASAPPTYQQFSSRRTTSITSIDPTTSFLSHPSCHSPGDSPLRVSERCSDFLCTPDKITEDVCGEERSFELEALEDATDVSAAADPGKFVSPLDPASHQTSGSEDVGIEKAHLSQAGAISPTMMRRAALHSDVKTQARLDFDATPRPKMKRTLVLPIKRSASVERSREVHTSNHSKPLVSRYAIYLSKIREITRNPVSVARHVVSSAWHSNWRSLSGFPWWVLGLFLGLKSRSERETNTSRVDQQERDFNWDYYSLGTRTCRRSAVLPTSETYTHTGYGTHNSCTDKTMNGRKTDAASLDYVKQSPDGDLPSLGPLGLWVRFSFAIIIAVGLAVRDGPASLLTGNLEPSEDEASNIDSVETLATSNSGNDAHKDAVFTKQSKNCRDHNIVWTPLQEEDCEEDE